MRGKAFTAELEMGHKGAAVIVPFDPEETWGIGPVPVASREYGERPGWPVRGALNGRAFDGWIGHRWGRFFVLVPAALQRAAGVRPGDLCACALSPAAPPKAAKRAAPAKRKAKPHPRRRTR
jgi:hypothetical protein